MRSIFASFLALTAAAVLSVCGWIALYHYQSEMPALIYYLLSKQPAATGVWLTLTVIGIDYSLTATRDSLGYRNVGSKARTHWRLTGGEK